MFAIEFTSTRPQGAAPYYSLVVREEYSLGSDPSCDIILSSPDILPQHVGLLVMRQSEANAEAEAAGGEGVYLDPPEGDGLGEQDPLVVFLTVLEPEEGTAAGGVVYVGDTEVPPGGSIILTDGTEAQFGASAAVVFHFRPLVVCVDSDLFHPDQAQDYLNLFYRLGATVCEVPTLNLQLPTPIGLLHCVEELSDDLSTVIALACGYTIVQPTYVLEWFAALAQKASSPLSVLPPPRRFEVPIRTVVNAATVTYTRPETDSAPFSLYPIPSTAVKSRSRESLFENQVFYFFTEAAAARYRLAVQQSGGTCVFPTEKEEALHNVRLLSVEQTPAPADRQPTDPFPVNFYIVVDSVAEATLLNEGLRGSSQELADFLEEAEKAGALYLPIIGDHTLFSSLLSNRLSLAPIPLGTEEQQAEEQPVDLEAYTFEDPNANRYVPYEEADAEGAPQEAPVPSIRSLPIRPSEASTNNNNNNRRLSREEIRRSSLLPRGDRTPSRSQLRSYSRQRAMSADRTSDRQSEGRSARSNSRRRSTTDAGGRGRSDTISFRDRFDLLRVRVYAFLLKEETKLDECQVSFARNHYIDDNTMEHTLEVRAQAQDFMEKIDDLLDESYGPYTDPLRGFWKDCSDIDEKAQKLYNSYQRQGKSRRRRGSSQRRPSATTTPRRTSSQEPRSTLNSSRHHIHEDAEDSLGNSRSVKDHRDLYRGVDPRDRRQSTEGSATPRGGRRASPARHVDPHRTTSPRNNNNTAAAVEQPSTTERRNSHRNVRNPAPATIRARRSSSVSERS